MQEWIYKNFATRAEADAKVRVLRKAGLSAEVRTNPRAKKLTWQVYEPRRGESGGDYANRERAGRII